MSGVFISYRRQDSAGHTGRLFDRLQNRLGRDRIFMDVTGIDAGVDFVHTIEQAVGSCDAQLVVIGPEWLSASDAQGRRRLDEPNDFVRLEIATALRRNVRVIPVLVAGASMPASDQLPDDLKPLARRQTLDVRDTRWDADVSELITLLERQLGVQPGAPPRNTRRNVAVACAIVIVGAAVAVPFALRHRPTEPSSPIASAPIESPSAPPAADASAPSDRDLMLDYQITALPNPKQHPGSSPIQVAGGTPLSAGDFVRFSFHSPRPGFLYVLNESPSRTGRDTSFNILFPTPTSNGGSARLGADQPLQIPERGDGFQLDEEQGAERLWLVWSLNALNEMDAVSHWANPVDKGEIKDAHDVDLVRSFLTGHASPAPEVQERAGRTVLSARGQALVKLVTLEHGR